MVLPLKLERTKNAKRNLKYGVANQTLALVAPFLIRTILIRYLGVQYLGLNSLYSSILSVLNLTELGFSSAIAFSMYRPIAEDDIDALCALMNFFRKVYRIIGSIILVFGLLVVPLLPRFISGSHPQNVNIFFAYLIYLCGTVVGYFNFAYYGTLVNAYQRYDIISKVTMVVNLVTYTVQIILIVWLRNYYLFIGVTVLSSIAVNLYTAALAKKTFPEISCRGMVKSETRKDIRVKVGGLMLMRASQASRNSFDSIFVSAFLGLTVTAIYTNYYFVMSAVISMLAIVASAIVAGVGNSTVTESTEKNYGDMMNIHFLYMWLSGWCTVCLLCLYQHFMLLWVGKTMMFDNLTVVLFCAYFYLLKMGDIRSIYLESNGLWWESRYRSIIEAVLNIALNYILGKWFGVYGIIGATMIALFFVNFCYGTTIVFRYYFKTQKSAPFFLQNAKYALITAGICAITYFACSKLPGYGILWFLVKGVVCCILPNVLYGLIYFRSKEFKAALPLVASILPSRIQKTFRSVLERRPER